MNANGAIISPEIITQGLVEARKEGCVTKVLMHPEMSFQIENIGMTVTGLDKIEVSDASGSLGTLTCTGPKTLGGIPILLLMTMPKDRIEFRDPNGRKVGEISNLGVIEDFGLDKTPFILDTLVR